MTKTNDRPNIFNYATKESYQDAMICWLIDWAGRQDQDVQNKEDEALRACGRRFVKALLAEHGDGASLDGVIKKTEILKQHKRIDVLARINGRQVLLIEDKTNTRDHSDQLKRYYEKVVGGKTGLGKVDKEDLFPIFLKTGNLTLAEEKRIEERVETGRSYKIFNRKEFLEKALNDYEGSNSILTDFRAYLQAWEDDAISFHDWKKGEREKWSWNAWEGFFRYLEEELKNCCGWGYVPNPAGGFRGLWWNAYPIKEGEVKLQLEIVPGELDKQRLCFKVGVNKEKLGSKPIGAVRNKWHNLVCDVANKGVPKGEEKAKRPDRFGSGFTMTVALWKESWLAFGDSGALDLDKTVANLKEVEAVLAKAKAIDMEERQGDETQS